MTRESEDKGGQPVVVQGGRQDLRIEDDPDQGWKVEPILPTDGQRNSEEQSRASEQDGPPAMPTPEAVAEADEPSVWEAIQPGVDPSDRGQ